MGKRGPAPKDLADLRRHQFGVYLNDAELAHVLAQAIPGGTDGLTPLGIRRRLARYIRDAALDRLPPRIPEINREAWRELSRVVANLNQYQAAINEGRAGGYPAEFLESLVSQVQRLRDELQGGRVLDGASEALE